MQLFPIKLSDSHPAQWIIWNVGQGQMVTLKTTKYCLHIDMGGEFFPDQELKTNCGTKKNYLLITHWDWDHISFVNQSQKILTDLCLMNVPRGSPSQKKVNTVSKLKKCQNSKFNFKDLSTYLDFKKNKHPNYLSHVFLFLKSKMLITGDAPSKSEKDWLLKYKADLKNVKYFILGHHGSHTSNSNELLQSLVHLKLTIVSARKKRYGHPHPNVTWKLIKKKVPLLTTEDWGHIFINIK